jgi:hypothetical protein
VGSFAVNASSRFVLARATRVFIASRLAVRSATEFPEICAMIWSSDLPASRSPRMACAMFTKSSALPSAAAMRRPKPGMIASTMADMRSRVIAESVAPKSACSSPKPYSRDPAIAARARAISSGERMLAKRFSVWASPVRNCWKVLPMSESLNQLSSNAPKSPKALRPR